MTFDLKIEKGVEIKQVNRPGRPAGTGKTKEYHLAIKIFDTLEVEDSVLISDEYSKKEVRNRLYKLVSTDIEKSKSSNIAYEGKKFVFRNETYTDENIKTVQGFRIHRTK